MGRRHSTPKPSTDADWSSDEETGTVRRADLPRWDADERTGARRSPGSVADPGTFPRFDADDQTGVVRRVEAEQIPPGRSPSERARALLDEIAETDPTDLLTGALNWAEFAKRLHDEVAATRSRDGEVGLLLIDVDHFELIETHYGVAEAARLQTELAEACRRELVQGGCLGRHGERFFALLFVDEARSSVRESACRILVAVRREIAFGPGCPMTSSMGCAFSTEVIDQSAGGLIDLAEQRLDEAIQSGGNRLVATGLFWPD